MTKIKPEYTNKKFKVFFWKPNKSTILCYKSGCFRWKFTLHALVSLEVKTEMK